MSKSNMSKSTVDHLLIEAAKGGDLEDVTKLLSKGANINTKDNGMDRATPLHWASKNGHFDVVKLLLDEGADISTRDYFEQTSLYRATVRGHAAIVKLLLDRGADVEAEDYCGDTRLSCASRNGNVDVVKVLLDLCRELCRLLSERLSATGTKRILGPLDLWHDCWL